jgi:ATPase subunit of ABC transporter with duplicated ATPase domains
LIISHNKEFCDGVATEKWIMNKGKLRIEGAPEEEAPEAKEKALGPKEDVYDGAGNKIDVKAQAAVSAKDAKKQIKDLEKKIKDGKKKKTLTEEEMWELEDKIAALKEKLEAA